MMLKKTLICKTYRDGFYSKENKNHLSVCEEIYATIAQTKLKYLK